jgi:hypothetical protein
MSNESGITRDRASCVGRVDAGVRQHASLKGLSNDAIGPVAGYEVTIGARLKMLF